MAKTHVKSPWVRSMVIALLVAAVGIVIQIVSGADYPLVPPGIIMLVAAAGVGWFVRWRWAPIVGVVAGLFQFAGTFFAGQAPRLVDFDPVGDSVGLWIQFIAVTVAILTGVVTMSRTGTTNART